MKLYAIVGGVEYDLNYGDPCFYEGDDGLGMPDLHRMEDRGPMQHGSSDRGYRLDPRYAAYVFGVIATSKSELWDKRQELLRIFRPTRQIIMKHVLENGDTRYLDCLFSGSLKMPAQDRRGGIIQKLSVVLKADDPTMYDPSLNSAIFNISAGTGEWAVPFAVPFEVGASVINQDLPLQYNGDVATYPMIRIEGPAEDPVLTNETLGLKLDFTGITIAGGTYYDIDLRYGYKTVVDNSGTNKVADLTADSDLATWRLETDPEAPEGINSLNLSCISATLATRCTLTYYDRFIGI